MNAPQTDLTELFKPLYSYELPAWWQTKAGVMIIIAGAVVTCALLSFLAWYRWWYKPPLTLEQWRDKEIEALGTLLNRHPVNYKRFFGAATFFFKQYLTRLYGWKILDKTDDELWRFIEQKNEIPKELHGSIQELLSYAQIVKFADAQALAEKAEEAQKHLTTITSSLRTKVVDKR